ncbi:MAG: DUF6261 family protein [Bergeyella zoohelcum]|nr:DUF6261 family protein [Bergeyella zoohelcum]
MKRLKTTIRVSELADTSLRMVDLFKKETTLTNDAFLKPLFTEIEEKTTALSIAIKKESAVSKLEEADELRDETIRNLYAILKGYKAMRNPQTKASATDLLEVFKRYGVEITRESYASESAHIESMLRDFSLAENLPKVEQLTEVKETIDELRERQTAFHNERLKYETALAETGSVAAATTLKKPLLQLINVKLVSFLTAMKEVEAYKNFAEIILQVIKDANELIAKRKKTKTE